MFAQDQLGKDPEEAPVRRLFVAAAVLTLLFMLLPAVNLMNITLSRIVERSEEIGVRKAFGASSWHLVGQLLVENSVLCLIGGALSLVLAAGSLRAIEVSGMLPYAEFHLNWRLFAVALALALVFALLSGVGPAWRMSRLRPVAALRGGPR